MAGTFNPTGAYTNLTRLELEELRRSDHSGNQKALTVGDSAYGPENVVGPGNLRAEPYISGAAVTGEDAPSFIPPTTPGTGLGTVTQVGPGASETVKWFGPLPLVSSTTGVCADGGGGGQHLTDNNVDFISSGVQAGDIVLVIAPSDATYGGSTQNKYARATVLSVSIHDLVCVNVIRTGGPDFYNGEGNYTYLVVRPTAIQLFAVPGSGAKGYEQTFLMVQPGSGLHNLLAPTLSQINAERITQVVPPQFSTGIADRADAVYASIDPRTVNYLGYRVVLYPDDGTGNGPDLSAPIATYTPVIDQTIPLNDQRMTFDYKAGVVRLSCAPKDGGDIKPDAGCVNATTGRLNLYAVYWAFDTVLTRGASRSLWATRSTEGILRAPGKVNFRSTPLYSGGPVNVWEITSAPSGLSSVNSAWIYAPDPDEDWRLPTMFGSANAGTWYPKYLAFYHNGNLPSAGNWRMLNTLPYASDPVWPYEVDIAQKHDLTFGDSGGPPLIAGDYNPIGYNDSPAGREVDTSLVNALREAGWGKYTTIRLGRGNYYTRTTYKQTCHIPPGVVIEGEGDDTVFEVYNRTTSNKVTPLFKMGPNTPWGTFDFDYIGGGSYTLSSKFDFPTNTRIEGIDVVWNPLRRVWGVFVADVTNNSIWFNEVGPNGVTRFTGNGIDIKSNSTNLFSTLSARSDSHTSGHYPRAAFDIRTGRYYVVWVEEHNPGPGIGPVVKLQGILVTETTADPLKGVAVGTAPPLTVTNAFSSPVSILRAPYDYSNHPSIAICTQNSTTKLALVAWVFDVAPGPTYNSGVARFYSNVVNPPSTPTFTVSVTTGANWPTTAVVSSTDIVNDGHTGWLAAWSVREHALIVGNTGRFDYLGVFSDPSLAPNALPVYGVKTGSRWMWLGRDTNLTPDATWNAVANGYTDSWGDSARVVSVTSGSPDTVTLRSDKTGLLLGFTSGPYQFWEFPFPIELVRDSGGAGGTWAAAGNTLTDLTADFSPSGSDVQPGDFIYVVTGGGSKEWREVQSVSPTVLSIVGTWTTTSPGTYSVHLGNDFNYAFVPTSYIECVRADVTTESSSPYRVVGRAETAGTNSFHLDQVEPDYVRLCKGADSFLLVWQAMDTTAKLATVEALNLQDNPGGTGSETHIPINDYRYPYRVYTGTHAALISRRGTILADTDISITDTTLSMFNEAITEDTKWLRTSLGSRNPLSRRPNWHYFSNIISATPSRVQNENCRNRQHFDLAVCAHNFIHRWTTSQTPSLLPDVTWSGSDYTIVSPTKNRYHSHVGVYRVDPVGNVTLHDATMYLGLGTAPTYDVINRRTLPTSPWAYFPSNGTVGQLQSSSLTAHSATLYETDASLLNKGPSTTTKLVEWVLVSNWINHCPKNLGFRVSGSGEVIVSSTFNTFADTIPEEDNVNPGLLSQDATVTVCRTSEVDRFTDAHLGNRGSLAPALTLTVGGTTFADDDVLVEHRYKSDIGFRGVAVGIPKVSSSLSLNEQPFCALAWGDTFYVCADRYLNSDTGWNYVAMFRQSFGPYNCGLKNFKIQAYDNRNTAGSMAIRSNHHVYTRWGSPPAISGVFASDGYRNLFVSIDGIVDYGHAIRGVYTNCLGRWPVSVEGSPINDNLSLVGGISYGIVPGETCKTNSLVTKSIDWPTYSGSPEVVWDGKRFVVSYVRNLNSSSSGTGRELLLSTLPGDELESEIHPGLVWTDPNRKQMSSRVLAKADLSFNYELGAPDTDMSPFVVSQSLATSGNTYAVVWVAGHAVISASQEVVVGVTVFDRSEMGTGCYDCENEPYYAGTYTAIGTFVSTSLTITDTTGYNFPGPAGIPVEIGDIVVIRGSDAEGVYRVTSTGSYPSTILTLDRNVPASSGAFFLHKPATPASGRTYILANYTMTPGDGGSTCYRHLVTSPKIIWDGQQYLATWVADLPKHLTSTYHGMDVRTVVIPEYGYGGGSQESSYGSERIFAPSTNPYRLGMMLLGTSSSRRLFFTNGIQTNVITVSGTYPNLYFTTTVDPKTVGITEGSLLAVQSGSSAGGPWVVTSVFGSGPSYNINVNSPVISTGMGTPTCDVYQTYVPKVKPGDRVHIGRLTLNGVDTDSPSVVTVNSVSYRGRYAELSEVIADTSTSDLTAWVEGYIESGSASGYQWNEFVTPNTSGPQVRALIPVLGATRKQGTYVAGRVWGVIYNEKSSEYAALITSSSTCRLIAWKRGTNRVIREEVVSPVIGYDAYGLGWNGDNYLVVACQESLVLGSLYDRNFNCLIGNSALPVLDLSLFIGNNLNQIPGPGYNYPGTGTLVNISRPYARRLQVKWNDKLSRWMVAVTVSWLNELETSSGDIVPKVWDSGSFAPNTIPSYNSVHWTADASNNIGKYFVPGLKVSVQNLAYTPTLIQRLTIVNRVANVGAGATVTFAERLVSSNPADYVFWQVLPREDVYLVTLGDNNVVVQLEDADGSFMDGMTLSGASDVEERWTNMTLPIWTHSGPILGRGGTGTASNPTSNYDRRYVRHKGLYGNRLLTPVGKVKLPSFTNITSATGAKHGRSR
jgi:hypothetical protein